MTVLGFVRRWKWEFASLAVVLAGVGAYLLINALSPNGLRPGERVQLGGGQVSFTAPQGWDQAGCSGLPATECVELVPADAGERDIINVHLLPGPISIEGDSPVAFLSLPEPPPGTQRITIDGVSAIRYDDPDYVMVVGLLPSEDLFTLTCEWDWWESGIRVGCDMIIDTLRLEWRV